MYQTRKETVSTAHHRLTDKEQYPSDNKATIKISQAKVKTLMKHPKYLIKWRVRCDSFLSNNQWDKILTALSMITESVVGIPVLTTCHRHCLRASNNHLCHLCQQDRIRKFRNMDRSALKEITGRMVLEALRGRRTLHWRYPEEHR